MYLRKRFGASYSIFHGVFWNIFNFVWIYPSCYIFDFPRFWSLNFDLDSVETWIFVCSFLVKRIIASVIIVSGIMISPHLLNPLAFNPQVSSKMAAIHGATDKGNIRLIQSPIKKLGIVNKVTLFDFRDPVYILRDDRIWHFSALLLSCQKNHNRCYLSSQRPCDTVIMWSLVFLKGRWISIYESSSLTNGPREAVQG